MILTYIDPLYFFATVALAIGSYSWSAAQFTVVLLSNGFSHGCAKGQGTSITDGCEGLVFGKYEIGIRIVSCRLRKPLRTMSTLSMNETSQNVLGSSEANVEGIGIRLPLKSTCEGSAKEKRCSSLNGTEVGRLVE